MGFLFITINGHLGSGKSTICCLLAEQFDFKVFNTGIFQRQTANELNISTLELNEKSKEDFSLDYKIDRAVVEYANAHNGERIVFDSRLAWHFVPRSFKVRLTIEPEIAAKRVFLHRQTREERFSSIQEALNNLTERQNSEVERYKLIYNVNINDESNYDLIVDTTALSPSEVVLAIIAEYKNFLKRSIDSALQSAPNSNYFVSRNLIDYNVPCATAKKISVDGIIQNALSKASENLNKKLYYVNSLLIDNFHNCNGKEVTQDIISDILQHRINAGSSTYLVSDFDYSDLKYISQRLNTIIKSNYIILP